MVLSISILSSRLNILQGDNAQGKTSLLEAVYVLATSRSFRTSRLADVIQFGATAAHVHARIHDVDHLRDQEVGIHATGRIAEVDGKPARRLAEYAVLTPAVIFDTTSMNLVAGPGAERRKLMDRLALFAMPSSYADALAYSHAVKARRRILQTRGSNARDLADWEEVIVRHGHAWAMARAVAVESLAASAQTMFSTIARNAQPLHLAFHRGTPAEASAFTAALASARDHDSRHRSDAIGRHKDDLRISLASRDLRSSASQGERRATVLAIKLAEIELLRVSRGTTPLLLLDDVSSELDATRMQAFLATVRDADPQVLLTTTRPELIPHRDLWAASDRCNYSVCAGDVERM